MASIPDMIHVARRPRPCHNSSHAQAPAIIPGGIATHDRRAGGGGRRFWRHWAKRLRYHLFFYLLWSHAAACRETKPARRGPGRGIISTC